MHRKILLEVLEFQLLRLKKLIMPLFHDYQGLMNGIMG